MTKSMFVELAFFDNDDLLCRGAISISPVEQVSEFVADRGERFRLTHQFEEPACRIFIECHKEDAIVSLSALRMGVHNSDDWESTDPAEPYQLCFRCKVAENW